MNREERKAWLEKNRNKILEQQKKDFTDIYNMTPEKYMSLDEYLKLLEVDKLNESKYLDRPMSDCKERVGNVDIHNYLEKIRHNDYETVIFLLIKDDKVVDEIIIKGSSHECYIPHEKYHEIAKKAKKLGASAYDVHNHPLTIVAQASKGDIKGSKDVIIPIFNKYGVKYLDWGVVTECDYYSAKEKGELL